MGVRRVSYWFAVESRDRYVLVLPFTVEFKHVLGRESRDVALVQVSLHLAEGCIEDKCTFLACTGNGRVTRKPPLLLQHGLVKLQNACLIMRRRNDLRRQRSHKHRFLLGFTTPCVLLV